MSSPIPPPDKGSFDELQRREPLSLRKLAALEASVLGDLPPDVCPRERPALRAYVRSVSRPTRRSRAVASIRARGREHRPGARRRAASSSTTSGSDPGDPDSEPPRRRGELRHIGEILAKLRIIAVVVPR